MNRNGCRITANILGLHLITSHIWHCARCVSKHLLWGSSRLRKIQYNTAILNNLTKQLNPGDILLFPSGQDFWFNGGIIASDLHDVTIQIDGSINFQNKVLKDQMGEIYCEWPSPSSDKYSECPMQHKVKECICIMNSTDLTITSNNTNKGVINGSAYLKDYKIKTTIDKKPINVTYQHGGE